jgi:tRNA G18 (ribose-2'-O)-methylase SpoU
VPETASAVAAAAASGYHVAAVENSPQAIDLYEWTPVWPVCLVFGHETDGVTPDLASGIQTHVRIPMLGDKRSLNVATAAGVVLYELLRRWRARAV